MKTTERFENAVTKLYNAFHYGELKLSNCTACAVGNICDNKSEWFSPIIEIKKSIYNYAETFEIIENDTIKKSGYSAFELSMIETKFAYGVNYANGEDKGWTMETKETQFNGLCKVIEYLCELDNIPNVMDIQSLFEYKEEVKPLSTVF